MSTTDQLLTNSAKNGLILGSPTDLAELQFGGIAEITKKRTSGFELPTSSLGSRLSAYKPCWYNTLQACFWPKMRFTSGQQVTEHSITSHYHVTTDQLSDQLRLRIIASYPPWPSLKGQILYHHRGLLKMPKSSYNRLDGIFGTHSR